MTSPRTTRLELDRLTPAACHALAKLASDGAADAVAAGLAPRLLELVRLRVSQLNGCRFCLDLHSREARAVGEQEERLRALAAWRASPLFSEDECAALALAESVTLVQQGDVPDEVSQSARARFDDAQVAHLLWTIALTNAYNRLAVASRIT